MTDRERDSEVVRTYKALEEALDEHVKALAKFDGEEGVIVTEWVACAANVSQETMRLDSEKAGIEPPTTSYAYLGSRTAHHSRRGLAMELLESFEVGDEDE